MKINSAVLGFVTGPVRCLNGKDSNPGPDGKSGSKTPCSGKRGRREIKRKACGLAGLLGDFYMVGDWAISAAALL